MDEILDVDRHHELMTLLKEKNKFCFHALGYSMLPFIWNGDKVCILCSDKVSVGDIILYQRNNGYVLHRLISIKKTPENVQYICKGDYLSHADPPIKKSQIQGKVVEIENNNRKINLESFSMRLVNYLMAKVFTHYLHSLLNLFLRLKTALNTSLP